MSLRRPISVITAVMIISLGFWGCGGGESGGKRSGGVDGILSVASASAFAVTGPEGGPFAGGSRSYRLNNSGSALVAWQGSATESWLTFSLSSGRLQPGAQVLVTVTLDPDLAATLPVGEYPAEILFIDRANPQGQVVLDFLLVVTPVGGIDDRVSDGLVALYEFNEAPAISSATPPAWDCRWT